MLGKVVIHSHKVGHFHVFVIKQTEYRQIGIEHPRYAERNSADEQKRNEHCGKNHIAHAFGLFLTAVIVVILIVRLFRRNGFVGPGLLF